MQILAILAALLTSGLLAWRVRRRRSRHARHRTESASVVQQAVAMTPAVGMALAMTASAATGGPAASAPEPPITASIRMVRGPSTGPIEVPPNVIARRALLDRAWAKKTRISRSPRRAAPKKPVRHLAPMLPRRAAAPVPHPAAPRPAPAPQPRPTVSASSGIRDRIISYAKTQLGLPYRYGAEQPGVAFDCSGLTEWVYAKVGINLPRIADAQWHASRHTSSPRPGDLVFYLSGNYAYHVGIYLSPGKMIVAPHAGSAVQVQTIWGSPTYATIL